MTLFEKLVMPSNWLARFRASSVSNWIRTTRITGGRSAQPVRKMLVHKQRALDVGEAMGVSEARVAGDPYKEYNLLMTEALKDRDLD